MNGGDSTTLIGMAAVVIATIGLALLMKFWITRKARRIEGAEAPDTRAIDGDCTAASRVYYLFSPSCGPCRSITPRIDALRQRHPNLIKLDVQQHPDLARAFNAMATPSFVWVRDDRVVEVKLGSVRQDWLLERLEA